MKTIVSSALALFAMGALPAQSADLRMPVKAPPPVYTPVVTWTGCYIGGNVGGGWAHENYVDPLGVPPAPLGSHTAKGVVGGGQLGCDWQMGSWVFGAQGLFDGANIKGDHLFAGDVYRTRVPWFGTATVRLGYTVAPNLLAYVKGGGAWKRDEETKIDAGIVEGAARTTRSGWTVGGGLEYQLTAGWSAFVEGDYMNFGRRSVIFTNLEVPPVPPTFPLGIRESISTVMVGLNYRLGGMGAR